MFGDRNEKIKHRNNDILLSKILVDEIFRILLILPQEKMFAISRLCGIEKDKSIVLNLART
jgi:hypothetical protein